jgi:peptidoglycan/LPS O-acetylase OafA/YrhL
VQKSRAKSITKIYKTMSASAKIHFTGLNALRFFAAYFVVLHHGETIRHKFGLPNFEGYAFFQNGALAVSFFFVLSGFLITYLLLTEIERTGTVSLRKFYMRRVLRIFPLYYLLVFIGLIAIPLLLHFIHYPNTQPYDTATGGVLFLFFLSFVVNATFGSHFLEPLWSIGVEEYFYLIWAPLFKKFKPAITPNLRRLQNLAGLRAVIVGMIVFKSLLILFFHFYPSENTTFNIIKDVLLSLKFELMAIGGLGALAVYKDRLSVEKAFYFKPVFQVVMLSLLFIRLFFHNYCVDNATLIGQIYRFLIFTPVFSVFTEGVLFLWLLLNVSVNPRAFFKLQNPLLDRLGEMSYGIYMYQMLVIFAVVLVFKKWMLQMPPSVSSLFFYAVVTLSVVVVSSVSKRFFEDRFLALKKRFE